MNIAAATKPFAVLGHPVRHSLSPRMHNAAFEALGMDAVYLALDIGPEHLTQALSSLGLLGFGGVNITVPLKECAFRTVERLDPSAEQMGAVNTVVFSPEGMRGFNTDGDGFSRAVTEAFGFSFSGRRILILGAGGAARAAAMASAREGAAHITVANRTPDRAEALVRDLGSRFPSVDAAALSLAEAERAALEADLVVQSTSVGLQAGDGAVLSRKAFRPGQCVYDMIYTQSLTPTLLEAQASGASVANGLDMLLYQGVRAFELWTGVEPPVEIMRRALRSGLAKS